jgi:hypothetical protein
LSSIHITFTPTYLCIDQKSMDYVHFVLPRARPWQLPVTQHLNKVMLVSIGRSTRSTLGRVGRTPSVAPILQNGVFVRVDQNAQPAPAPVSQANQLPVIEEEGEEGGEEDEVAQNNGDGDDQDEDE